MHLWPDIGRPGCRDFRVGLTSAELALSATARHRLGSSIAECHLFQPVNKHSFYCFATGLGDYTHELPSRLGRPTNRFPWVCETRCAEEN